MDSNIEDLPSNPYSNIMLDIQDNSDSVPEFDKLNINGISGGPAVARFGPAIGPVCPPSSSMSCVRQSPPGLMSGPRPSFEPDWPRPSDAWSKNPLNFNPLGDLSPWKPLTEPTWGPAPGPSNGPKPSTQGPVCVSCADGHLVTSRCRDCSEDLCDNCVRAHQRVKLTRDHAIVRYPDNKQTLFGQHVPPVSSAPATSDVLRVFNETVEKAKQENANNISRAEAGYVECEKALERMNRRSIQIGMVVSQVSQEIKDVSQRIVYAVKEKEEMLINRLDRIRNVKLQALGEQEAEIRQAMLMLDNIVKHLEQTNRSNREMDIINMNKTAVETIRAAQNLCGNLEPSEDANIHFHPPEPNLVQTLTNVGLITTSGFAPLCCAEGDGLHKGVLGREAKFCVLIKDHVGDLTLQGDSLNVVIKSPDNRQVWWEKISDTNQPGRFLVRWRPHIEGDHSLAITLHGRHIEASPFKCIVKAGRDYNNVGLPVLEFSQEGNGDGDLCRPWGICCTPTGRMYQAFLDIFRNIYSGLIVVADRSNNRICVFNRDGSYHSKFGTEGTRNGQFNRPASVCLDGLNRLIVTDKDNHRMQIFSLEGELQILVMIMIVIYRASPQKNTVVAFC